MFQSRFSTKFDLCDLLKSLSSENKLLFPAVGSIERHMNMSPSPHHSAVDMKASSVTYAN